MGSAPAGCVGPATATDLPSGGDPAARKLYVAKCARCHKFYDPAQYSDAEWQKWMGKMGKKSKLKPGQQEMLARYIEGTFRTPEKTNRAAVKP